MSEARSGELSTLSTPPTVRTLVQTTGGVTTPRDPTEERTRGESEGGEREKPANESGPLDAGWARALSSRASCATGRCAYADPAKPPNKYLGAVGCDGYHATRTLDDGRPTVRWGLCPRHREWWRLQRMRRAKS
jgi:hypothetical protein